jgi:hypothetical protein
MRLLRFALSVACLGLVALRAEEDDKDNKGPVPEEIPDFSRLDEYIYVPKSTLSLGSRVFINGPKTTYGGQGAVPQDVGTLSSPTIPNVSRTYDDGTVQPDTRATSQSSGIGGSVSQPIPSDGRTNSWAYANNNQLLPNGDIAFHIYSGQVTDTGTYHTTGRPGAGVELLLDRDIGKIGKKIKLSFVAGFSLADIHSSVYANVATNETVVTDTYDLFGQVPPSAPFTSPSALSQTVLNSSGQPVTATGSTSTSQIANQVILIGNKPLTETTTTILATTQNRFFTEGAYYTLRAGPNLLFPITNHLKLTASIGPELLVSGTTYNVLEDLVVATGDKTLTQLYQRHTTRALPGFYADVDVRYDLTDTAGLYLGGLYESSGNYEQTVASGGTSEYSTKIDFQSQEGVKAGMTVRF